MQTQMMKVKGSTVGEHVLYILDKSIFLMGPLYKGVLVLFAFTWWGSEKTLEQRGYLTPEQNDF